MIEVESWVEENFVFDFVIMLADIKIISSRDNYGCQRA